MKKQKKICKQIIQEKMKIRALSSQLIFVLFFEKNFFEKIKIGQF